MQTLHLCECATPELLGAVAACCPRLRHLSIASKQPQMVRTLLDSWQSIPFSSFSSLEGLSISLPGITTHLPKQAVSHLPALTKLTLQGLSSSSTLKNLQGLAMLQLELATSCTGLQRLTLAAQASLALCFAVPLAWHMLLLWVHARALPG